MKIHPIFVAAFFTKYPGPAAAAAASSKSTKSTKASKSAKTSMPAGGGGPNPAPPTSCDSGFSCGSNLDCVLNGYTTCLDGCCTGAVGNPSDQFPTESPTTSPTPVPTKDPTQAPTKIPTELPSTSPTPLPSKNPTQAPTKEPTKNPSESPSTSPTPVPTKNPTQAPTKEPTKNPSESPSTSPTPVPSKNPTQGPTKEPTKSPSTSPVAAASLFPTSSPVMTCNNATCTSCVNYDCNYSPDCCSASGEECMHRGVCRDVTDCRPPETIINCTRTCDPRNKTKALEQCAFLNIPDSYVWCDSFFPVEKCMPSTQAPDPGHCDVPYRRRELRQGEVPVSTDVPLKRRLEIIESMSHYGAKPDATFSSMYGLITKESCDSLIKFLDKSLDHDIDAGVDLPLTSKEDQKHVSWVPFEEGGIHNQYNLKLYTNQIVALIGVEETMKLIDYFQKSFGDNLAIDCMYLVRHGDPSGDGLFTVPWHMDDYATMEITLNDNYSGGEVLHLNAEGVHKTEPRPGSVTAHTDDIVHGITPMTNGAKYMLILKHHFNRPDKVGVVRLSKELVNEVVANMRDSV